MANRSSFKMTSAKTARVWFSIVTESDAKALCKWWNGHGSFAAYYTYQTSAANPRFFDVMRNPVTTETDQDKWWSMPWSGHEEKVSC